MPKKNTGMLWPLDEVFFSSVADVKNVMFIFESTGKGGALCQKLGLGKRAGLEMWGVPARSWDLWGREDGSGASFAKGRAQLLF